MIRARCASSIAPTRQLSQRFCATAGSSKLGPFHLVECPRDAMQGLKNFVPTEDKIRFINALLRVGFDTLDCGSFVSAPAVPQMRDTAEVLSALDLSTTKSKLLVVVANLKGAITAAENPRVTYIGYPLSACETFQRKNTKRDIAQALEDLAEIKKVCDKANKELVVYISMGFGNPYGEPYSPDIVFDLTQKMVNLGATIISLADTVGVAEPPLIKELYERVIPTFPGVQFGAHLHSGASSADEKLRTAIAAGCKRFDGALGGMGGCPFAKSTLVGNVPTESIVDTMGHLGIDLGLNSAALAEASKIKDEVFGVGMKELMLATVLHDERALLEMCLTFFRAADTQHRGFLDQDQFVDSLRNAYSDLGEDPPKDEVLRRKYSEMDLSKDGHITFDEYMVGVRRGLRKRLEKKIQTGL